MELKGRGVLVTGGARRIGREIALALAAEGMAVAIHYHTSARDAAAVVESIRGRGGTATAVEGDLRNVAAAKDVFARAAAALGPIAALINNASVFTKTDPSRVGTGGEGGAKELREELALHLESPYVLSGELARALPEGVEGRIVNLVDWRASLPDPRCVEYSISKGALLSMTRTLARALAPRVTVNAIAPGAILPPSDGSGKNSGDLFAALPLPRQGRVADIVRACIYLLRDADYTTGAVIPVDGGRHLL